MNSNFTISMQYSLFSILFIVASFLLAYNFWWRIDYNSAEFFILVLATMICWIGIGYLSTLIAGKIIFKTLQEVGFVSPFKLISSGFFYETKGIEIAKKFKTMFSAFAFPVLMILIFLFYQIVNFIEKTDLAYYGVEKMAKIEKISYFKGVKRGHITFEFGNYKIKKIVYLSDTLKNVGDYEAIVFSSRNPYIVENLSEYK
ncbi:hypothetical protein NZ698_15485 [Chryseobacterium sp. PBS4-4]|uniref:Uncharacterized protein n=1 Tax=Chryseobacterium edaphi TaxID=2976532 RepID=A0ABT2W8P5_9FLAO|nr:hypothetical protein [Chryseobacterium edaphi]MCU7618596.1 hypothetical protein [Chryseobacterium edaphi]